MGKFLIKIYKCLKSKLFTFIAIQRIGGYGKGLKINGKTLLTRNTFLGSNVNFNGMQISGLGKVIIGDNFHSGIECMMITQFHNYDHGKAIPYDNTYYYKNIVIEDNVWLGNKVIILGGVVIGEGAIVNAGVKLP